MAGKNQVTLTFAGETKDLEKSVKGADDALSKFEKAADRAGSSTRSMGDDLDRAGGSTERFAERSSRLNRIAGEGGRSFGEYGRGLGGVGDRFDEVDTRAMGAADGFAGLTDAMRWNQLTAQEQAMVFSDMGSSMYNLVIPSLQDGVQKVRNFTDGLKTGEGAGGAFRRNLGAIAAGAVAAGGAIALLTMHFQDNAQRQQEAKERAQEFATAMRTSGGDVQSAGASVLATSENYETLRGFIADAGLTVDDFAAQVEDGTLDIGQLSEQMNLNKGETAGLMFAVGEYTAARERASETERDAAAVTRESTAALQEYSDELRAQFDPLFGMMDAQQQNAEAQANLRFAQLGLNEAIREHGAGSLEAAAAQQTLTDAENTARGAVIDLEGAATDLRMAVQNGTVSASDARAQFIGMAMDMGYTKGEAQGLSSQFGITTAEAQRLGGQRPHVPVTQSGATDVFNRLLGVRDAANSIPDEVRIQVRAFGTSVGQILAMGGMAGGGIVAQYAAAGMVVGGGPRGTDTVPMWLTPGEMVLNDAQQAELFAMANGRGGGGGAPVVINVGGSILSDRDLVRIIRDEFDRGGFGGRR